MDERRFYIRESLPTVDCYVAYVLATSIEAYTPREVKRAVRARKLYHDLSAETYKMSKYGCVLIKHRKQICLLMI